MNERIRRLMEQAVTSIDGQTFGKTYIPDEFTEKFAELIVRECCNKIESEYKYALGEKTQWAMSQDVQDMLKKYFGVEE